MEQRAERAQSELVIQDENVENELPNRDARIYSALVRRLTHEMLQNDTRFRTNTQDKEREKKLSVQFRSESALKEEPEGYMSRRVDVAILKFIREQVRENLVQAACWASFRLSEADGYQRGVIAVTPHYWVIVIYNNGDWLLRKAVNILKIKKLYGGLTYEGKIFGMLRLWDNDSKARRRQLAFRSTNENTIEQLVLLHRNIALAYSMAYGMPRSNAPVRLKPVLEMPPSVSRCCPYFNPELSAGQMFQFTYWALCSQENIEYNHSIVNYFHYNVLNRNGVFDFADMGLEVGGEPGKNLMPVLRAMMYFPYLTGVVCNGKGKSMTKCLKMVLQQSKSIEVLHLAKSDLDLSELQSALEKNRECPLKYIDLSRTKSEALPSFCRHALATRQHHIVYLGLNDTNLSDDTLSELIHLINTSESLRKLRYFHVAGSEFGHKSRKAFKNFTVSHDEKVKRYLTSLDLSRISQDITDVIEQVLEAHHPLENMILSETQVSSCEKVVYEFATNSRHLSYLDITRTGMSDRAISGIIFNMGVRDGPNMQTIKMGYLGLHGSSTRLLITAFMLGQLSRWKCIHLDGNHMKPSDLSQWQPLFHSMPNLEELSLSDNFKESQKDIGVWLIGLLRTPRLKKLILRGTRKRQLGKKCLMLLFAVGLSYVVRSTVSRNPVVRMPDVEEYVRNAINAIDTPLRFHGPQNMDKHDSTWFCNGFEDMARRLITSAQVTDFQSDGNFKERIVEIFTTLAPLFKVVTNDVPYSDPTVHIYCPVGTEVANMLFQWTERKKKSKAQADVLADTEFLKLMRNQISVISNWLANCCQLEELDLSGNDLESNGLEAIGELIKIDKELKGVRIDEYGCDKVSVVSKLIDIIEDPEQWHITRMKLPHRFILDMVDRSSSEMQSAVERDLINEKDRLDRICAKNRVRQSECAKLPFDMCSDLRNIVVSSRDRQIQDFPKKLLQSHSGVGDDFGLPLPFLTREEARPNFEIVTMPHMAIWSEDSPGVVKKYHEAHDFAPKWPFQPSFGLLRPAATREQEVVLTEKVDPVDRSELHDMLGFKPPMLQWSVDSEKSSEEEEEEEEVFEQTEAPSLDLNETEIPQPNLYEGKISDSDQEEESEQENLSMTERNRGSLEQQLHLRVDEDQQVDIEHKGRRFEGPPSWLMSSFSRR